MNTSYYSKYKGENGVCISLYKPQGWKGLHYPSLSPSSRLLLDYKKGLVTDEGFELRYKEETLSKLDPNKVYKELRGKVLLGHYDTRSLCHRHMIAKWLKETIGVDVSEL